VEGEVVPVGLLQNLAFGGHPQAKHALSIRSAVCRSIARLEARDLIQRVRGQFTPTVDGRMLVAIDLTVNETPLTDTESGAVAS
jgi:phage baseplate assembly protein W